MLIIYMLAITIHKYTFHLNNLTMMIISMLLMTIMTIHKETTPLNNLTMMNLNLNQEARYSITVRKIH